MLTVTLEIQPFAFGETVLSVEQEIAKRFRKDERFELVLASPDGY